MRGFGLRSLGIALAACAALGADIALAGQQAEPVRLPVGTGSPHNPVSRTVTVVKGDHLWKISERHLEGQMRRPPSSSEISPYWRQVVDENRTNLRSGNPDLIYPGEVIELPETGHLSGQP